MRALHLRELLIDEAPEPRQMRGPVAHRRVVIGDPLRVAVEIQRRHCPEPLRDVGSIGQLSGADAAGAHQPRRPPLRRAVEDPQRAQGAVERVDPAREMLDRDRAQIVLGDRIQPLITTREQDPQTQRLRSMVRVVTRPVQSIDRCAQARVLDVQRVTRR
jgi:hypothetical protein